MSTAVSRAFAVLLALLIASFFFVPEQHQRNWVLYLAALTAHGALFDKITVRGAFVGRAGWAVPALLAMPVLSLLWSGPVDQESAKDLLLAAYCVLLVYLGVARLTARSPQTFERLQQTLLLGANLGALLSLAAWASSFDASWPRLPGALGLDNPVHGSILLLAATLPVWNGFARGRLRVSWLLACVAPCAFALLAGPRTALVAYILVVAFLLRVRFRPATMVAGTVVLGAAGLAALVGSDSLRAIWLHRGLSFRPEIWEQAWAAYLSCNPLIGCGIAFPLEVEYFPGNFTDRAHSLYMAALYHQGFVGAAVFLGVAVWLLYCSRDALSVRGGTFSVRDGTPAVGNGTPVEDGTSALRDGIPAVPEGPQARDGALAAPMEPGRASLPGQRRDWAIMLAYALLASTTSGDHILVRTSLFWCYFWLPVIVLAASASGVSEPGRRRENSPGDPA